MKCEEFVFQLNCPNCGKDRSGLIGCTHDFINDCPACRTGPSGPTIAKKPKKRPPARPPGWRLATGPPGPIDVYLYRVNGPTSHRKPNLEEQESTTLEDLMIRNTEYCDNRRGYAFGEGLFLGGTAKTWGSIHYMTVRGKRKYKNH